MSHLPRWTLDFLIWILSLAAVYSFWRTSAHRRALRILLAACAGWLCAGMFTSIIRFAILFPNPAVVFIRGGAIVVSVWLMCAIAVRLFWNRMPRFDPNRRRVLNAVRTATFAAPAAIFAVAYIKRDELRLREIDVPIPNLHPDLRGLRLVQISDIHLSPLVSESLLARAIGMANQTRAHVGLITGDLISRTGDPLDTCFRHLARLRVDSTILGCLGNHEIYAESEDYTAAMGARLGMDFLRRQKRVLRFGGARLNFAGVDHQTLRKGPYLAGAEQLIEPGVPNILLSHNPDVFPVAAAKGYDLTISGHTHGGQVNIEILHENLNIARFLTPYVYGLYRHGPASIFVTRGVGTIGIPGRLGAPPEVALIRLCAS